MTKIQAEAFLDGLRKLEDLNPELYHKYGSFTNCNLVFREPITEASKN